MQFSKRFIGVALSAVLCATAAVGTTAAAEELRYAMGMPPGSDSAELAKDYAKAVKQYTDGELTVKVYPLSLLNFAETSAGVRDGIADIGYLLTPYFPAAYPHTNMIAEASMMLTLLGDKVNGKEGMAYVGALNEFFFFHCPECNAEYARQNQVYTGSAGSSPYILQCTQPVKSIDDLQGKRLRVGAASWSRWAEHIGATPITMSANEMHEALSQGVVDCIVLSVPEITNFGLMETVTDITRAVPGGIFAGTAVTNVNQDVWRSLTEDQRRGLLHAATVMSAGIPYVYHQREEQILQQIKKKGGQVHEPEPALVEATHEFVKQDLETIAELYEEQYGVKNGEQMLATFRPILEKWVGLVQDVDSRQELAQLYWDEVFSKVDVSTHGL